MSLWNRLLDASVVRSFDRHGFERHAREFRPQDLQVDLRGTTVLVTGANSGLGLATTRALAKLGARVVMLCRDATRGEQARAQLGGLSVELLPLDVSSLADVRRFAAAYSGPVDVLVNNAGVLPRSLQRTTEGFELTFATNVLGPFALTTLLLPKLRASRGRVVTVSSGGMYLQKLNLPALQGHGGTFDGTAAYAQTKRAEVVLNHLWAEREPAISFTAMHPGWADTPGVSGSLPKFHALTKGILRTAEQGADTIVWLAAGPRQDSGTFWFDRRAVSPWVVPGTRESAADRDGLWALCEQLSASSR